MKTRSFRKFAKVGKWVGTPIAVFILVSAVLSVWWRFEVLSHNRQLFVRNGLIGLYTNLPIPSGAANAAAARTHYFTHKATAHDPIDLQWWFQWNQNPVFTVVSAPLWLFFLLVAIPTRFLWWYDRHRFPPGHCIKCGYDLSATLAQAPCPECGTPSGKASLQLS